MKKFSILLIAVFTCSLGFSQRTSSQDLTNMGIMNGCQDAKASNANARFAQIMYSSAQQQAYKEGYELGWTRCRKSSGTYTWYKGKLVFKAPKSKRNNKARPCSKDFPGTSSTDGCI